MLDAATDEVLPGQAAGHEPEQLLPADLREPPQSLQLLIANYGDLVLGLAARYAPAGPAGIRKRPAGSVPVQQLACGSVGDIAPHGEMEEQ